MVRVRAWIPVVAVIGACAVAAGSAVATSERVTARKPTLPALPTKRMAAADRARIAAITRELLATETNKREIPGIVIGIWSPRDGVYRASFGVSDVKSRSRPKLASRFRIGSVSKTFTATVVLELVGEGKLALTGTVRRYLPQLARKYPAIGTRTVAQLLGMRSGLPEYADAAVPQQSRSPRRVWAADELIALGMRSGPVKRAGAATASYSNTNYVILGQIAQAVTGTPLDRLVRERLLRPLGLRHTVYPSRTQNRLPAPFTRGYVGPGGVAEIVEKGGKVKPGADVTFWNPSWGDAAGMMISTIDDLARWSNGVFGNALLTPKLRQKRLDGRPLDASIRYGLGIMTLPGGRWIGHEGGIPGWSTWALKDTTTATVVVTSVNACCGGAPAAFTVDLLRQLYPESFATGRLLKGGTAFRLSSTTTFAPPAGWRVDVARSIEGESLAAVKRGVVLEVNDAGAIPAGQTFDSWAAILREGDEAPGTTVGSSASFATASGLEGRTWTATSAARSARNWLVTNGDKIVRVYAYGSAAAVARVTGELDRMARSITMTPP